MKIYPACVPCLFQQSYNTSALATKDPKTQEKILRGVARNISEMSLEQPPPRMAAIISQLIHESTGNPDPYKEIKTYYNELVLKEYDHFQRQVRSSIEPLNTAIRFAIAGNSIDLGAPCADYKKPVTLLAQEALDASSPMDQTEELLSAISNAKEILYLADNTGEIVFDKLLIEELKGKRVTVVVRGGPVLNDVTLEDAKWVGLEGLVNIVAAQKISPGLLLEEESKEMQERFRNADLVISKGQGNYETLESQCHPQLFFLFKVKCSVVAEHLQCPVGSAIVMKG